MRDPEEAHDYHHKRSRGVAWSPPREIERRRTTTTMRDREEARDTTMRDRKEARDTTMWDREEATKVTWCEREEDKESSLHNDKVTHRWLWLKFLVVLNVTDWDFWLDWEFCRFQFLWFELDSQCRDEDNDD